MNVKVLDTYLTFTKMIKTTFPNKIFSKLVQGWIAIIRVTLANLVMCRWLKDKTTKRTMEYTRVK